MATDIGVDMHIERKLRNRQTVIATWRLTTIWVGGAPCRAMA